MSTRKKPWGNVTEDQLLKRIQPGLEERERVLDPRHALCFEEHVAKVDLAEIRETLRRPKKTRKPCTPGIYRRKMKEPRKGERKEEGAEGEVKKEEQVEGNGEEEDAIENDARTREETTAAGRSGGRRIGKKGRGARTRTGGRGKWKDARRESEEDSECDSICSFDSEVCLAGVTLTVEDKKEIRDNRRRVQKNAGGSGK